MKVDGSELDRGGSAGKEAWNSGTASPPGSGYSKDKAEQKTGGCWGSFSGCVGGLWATRQTSTADDREIYVRTTLRELVVYLLFLIILCILTFGMTSSTQYYYTQVLSSLFLDSKFPDEDTTFRDITEVIDVWAFTESVLLDGLYWEFWYDVQETPTDEDDRNILYENRLLGVPRIRQIRVRNDSCEIPPDFQRAIKQCFASYDPQFEDKLPFGPGNTSTWTYLSESQMNGTTYWGTLATYSGAGSYVDLTTMKNESKEIIADLRQNLWITRGTRVMFIDFTVYNANINLFCIIKLVCEFPATGGVLPSWSFKTVKLLRYVTPSDYFVMACELIFIFFIIYYMVEEGIEVSKLKCAYFKSLWNILDIVVIGLALACIGFSAYSTLTISSVLEELLVNEQEYPDFEFLGFWQTQFNNALAVCVFFSWFKLFKYISFNKTMTQLSSTLSRSAKDVAGFAIMFFIVFFAFAQLGYLLFGTQVNSFSTFINSVFTLLRLILGDFDFQAIEEANRVLGPIFFISYVFFVFFVLLNMFLAIINDTYAEVKAEIASQRSEFEIADYFRRGYNNMLGKFGKRDKLIDIENTLKLADTNVDGRLSYEEIRQNLKKCNFSDMEIEMFFAKYDLDGDKLLEPEEVKKMMLDLEGQKLELEYQTANESRPDSGRSSGSARSRRPYSSRSMLGVTPEITSEEFNVLQRRVDRLEHSIGSIVSKIDAVLIKLDFMEKSKFKKREAMSKILDNITADGMDENEKKKHMEQIVRDELDKWDGGTK